MVDCFSAWSRMRNSTQPHVYFYPIFWNLLTLCAVFHKPSESCKDSGREVIYFHCVVATYAVDSHTNSGHDEEG